MNEQRHVWLDDPGNQAKVTYGLYAICGILLLCDFLLDKHPHFHFEGWFGFYAWFGFLSCIGLTVVAQGLRVILRREEDYYDR